MRKLFFLLVGLLAASCVSPVPAHAQVNVSVMMDKTNSWLRSTNFFRSNLFAGSGMTLTFGTNGSVTFASSGGGSGQPASANLTNWSGVGTNQVVFVTDFQTYTNGIGAAYQPADAQLTNLAGLSYGGNASKYIRVNAGETGFELATVGGGGVTFEPTQFGTGGGNTNIKSGATLTNLSFYGTHSFFGSDLTWTLAAVDSPNMLRFNYNSIGTVSIGSEFIGPESDGYLYDLGRNGIAYSTLHTTNGNFYGGITNDTLTASRLVYSDANKKLSSVTITAPLALTAGTLAVPNFVGDSGSGGTAGLVPAPASGDSGKYLKGDGTWGVVSGSGTLTGITNAGNSSYSLINSSNSPVPALKSLSISGGTLTDQGTNILVTVSSSTPGYILVRDEKAQGTNGGTFTAGAWRTRDLNSLAVDTTGAATLTTNTITLPAGTYRVNIQVPAVRVNLHQAWLTNLTAGQVQLIGSVGFTSATAAEGQDLSMIKGRFTIASPSEFQIQHQCGTTAANIGFGNGGSGTSFATNYFTIAEFFKE